MSEQTAPETQPPERRKGLMARHPRLAILLIGALFILPLCAMIATVAVLIAVQIMNA